MLWISQCIMSVKCNCVIIMSLIVMIMLVGVFNDIMMFDTCLHDIIMSCERLGARRRGISQTHWCCASAHLQNNASRFIHKRTHSLHKTVDSGMQQAGAEELGGAWYQPSLLSTHVASYNNMRWSILAPPSNITCSLEIHHTINDLK